jgi:hypothetical protein
MKKFILATILSFFMLTLFMIHKVAAADIDVITNREYSVDREINMSVRETRTIINNTDNQIIKKDDNRELFTITALYRSQNTSDILEEIVSSAIVYDENGAAINFTTEYRDFSVILYVPYQEDIESGDRYTFTLTYNHPQLAQKNGALVDIFIQAFSEDFNFFTNNTSYTYNIKLKVSDELPEENFIFPSPNTQSIEDGFKTYTFRGEQLKGNYVWLQLGLEQYYRFNITQELPATEKFLTGNKNEYKIILPRNQTAAKVKQTVFYDSIQPEPSNIEIDEYGNVIGTFLINSSEDNTIEINGYANVKILNNSDFEIKGNIGDYTQLINQGVLDESNLSEAPFWEVNSPEIVNQANQLKNGSQDVEQIVNETYNYIVDSIDYSQVKRFGINERQGALETLRGGAAVCMEYSDLYITLLRAQGVPARAAFGYGYDSKEITNQQELHQWVQVYIPKTKTWLNVDPTWGENGPALIGGDMNHFLTHTATEDPNSPPTLTAKTFGSSLEFPPIDFKVEIIDSLPEDKKLDSINEISSKYKEKNNSSVDNSLNNYLDRYTAGLESLSTEGLNIQNTSQIIAIAITSIGAIVLIWIVSIIFKKLKNN